MPEDAQHETVEERRLALEEASSRRWDIVIERVVGLPFFAIDKICSLWGAVILSAYFFFVHGAEHLAGEDTNVFIGGVLDLGLQRWPYWLAIAILAAAFILLAWCFRRYIKDKGQREKELEAMIDPERSSSGLTPSGQPPE